MLLSATVLVVLGALVLALPGIELAPYAQDWLSGQAGRRVSLASLRVTPGLTTRLELRDARLANIPGGTRAEMLHVPHLRAALALMPLLQGRLELREVEAEGASLLLERDAERRGNWQGARQTRAAGPSGRDGGWFVGLLRLARAEIILRTSSGNTLTIGLEEAEVLAASPAAPVRLHARGRYNALPVALQGELGSFDTLAQARHPFPLHLRAQSRQTQLMLEATAADPLNFDHWQGRLEARAPDLAALLRDFGVEDGPATTLELTGQASRAGDVWTLAQASGALAGEALSVPLLRLTEGLPGTADSVAAEVDATKLDLNRILGRPAGPVPDRDADTPLRVDPNPDPRLQMRASATELLYGEWRAQQAALRLEVAPGRITLEQAAGTIAGARLQAAAEARALPEGAAVEASLNMANGRLDTLRQLPGIRSLPLDGAVQGQASLSMRGATVRQALRGAYGTTVLSMRDGTIDRAVIEAASTDLRALFRTAPGRTRLRCALAVLVVREGRGRVAPLRLRADTGTVGGSALFDLNRRQFELAVRSQRDSTDFLALDLPVRVYGSFAAPSVGLGERGDIPGDGAIPLPDGLREAVRRSGC